MKQAIQAIIALSLLFSAMSLSGCDQAKDLATQAAEKAKQDVVAEITKVVKDVGQAEKTGAESSKDTDNEEDK